jgi:hypothetical protein
MRLKCLERGLQFRSSIISLTTAKQSTSCINLQRITFWVNTFRVNITSAPVTARGSLEDRLMIALSLGYGCSYSFKHWSISGFQPQRRSGTIYSIDFWRADRNLQHLKHSSRYPISFSKPLPSFITPHYDDTSPYLLDLCWTSLNVTARRSRHCSSKNGLHFFRLYTGPVAERTCS